MPDPILIFIDLDETLWHGVRPHDAHTFLPVSQQAAYLRMEEFEQLEFWEAHGQDIVVEEAYGGYVVNMLRPQARDFIRRCKALANTAILTYGDSEVQYPIWNAHGLPNIKIFAYQDLNNLPQSSNSILIDNWNSGHPHCHHKLISLGIRSDRLIVAKEFVGNRGDKSLLSVTLPKVQEMVKKSL